MRNLIIWCLLAVLLCPATAKSQLSEDAKISVLTSAPYNEEVFTVFGHAAFRVHDPAYDYDVVFNYGIFDFTQQNFILRFALGETDYKLGVVKYASYITEYQMRGSDVTEQVLDLNHHDMNALYAALSLNAQPENRVYRYNFFFDNCATRLPAMIEKYVTEGIVYHNPPQAKTFRQMVHDCTRQNAWLTFGIDLALGSRTDRPVTPHEMMFLPEYVKQELGQATLLGADTEERPLVSATHITRALVLDDEDQSIWNTLLTPLVCGWLLFAGIAFLTFGEFRKGKRYSNIDLILFTIAGIAGCVLFFLCFISTHPCIWPNWSVVWLHPFHLLGVVLFTLKKAKKAAYYYHFINFATLLFLWIGWLVIPQQMNAAFIPFIATLALRSGWSAFCYKMNI